MTKKMDYIDVFNATMDELIHDDPDSHASKTIRKLLSARRNNNYYICIDQFMLRNGLKFYAMPSDTEYVPCLEYYEGNAFAEKVQKKLLRNNPVAHDYCYYIIAKELVEILNSRTEVV
jgi:hypothetical protein